MTTKQIAITSLIFNFVLAFAVVKMFQGFQAYLTMPYYNLVIPETGESVRMELNRFYPSPYDTKGYIAQWKYPQDNGDDFEANNKGMTKFGNVQKIKKLEQAGINWEYINGHKVS